MRRHRKDSWKVLVIVPALVIGVPAYLYFEFPRAFWALLVGILLIIVVLVASFIKKR